MCLNPRDGQEYCELLSLMFDSSIKDAVINFIKKYTPSKKIDEIFTLYKDSDNNNLMHYTDC